jgi:hypothetical protein
LIELEEWWNLEEQIDMICRQFLAAESDDQVLITLNRIQILTTRSLLILFFNYKFLSTTENLKESKALLKYLHVRKSDLTEFYVSRSNNLSQTMVKDFDWTLKVV